MKRYPHFILIGSALALAGCTFPSSRTIVDRHQVGMIQHVSLGTVEAVGSAVVAGRRGQIGRYGGGAAGAVAVSNVGSGVGNGLAQVGGAIVGAVAGEAVEEVLTRKEAEEVTVKLDSGASVVVIQVRDGVALQVGDRVRVLSGGRVERL